MTPFSVRLPTVMGAIGKIGYLYAKGEADGSWRITDRELGSHEIVGACDTPEALIPRLRDHLDSWCKEQAEIVAHNLAVIERNPPPRGARKTWKAGQRVQERESLKRALASAARVLQAVASVAKANGWPVEGYCGEFLEIAGAGLLAEPNRGAMAVTI